jgi:hypothetical protein
VPTTDPGLEPDDERRIGIALFNATWTLLDQPERTRDEDDTLLHMAHASRHHWGRSNPPPANLARGEWQCSRVYAVLGRAEPARFHAQRCLDLCTENGIGDFDLAFAYEALARAAAVAGNADDARGHAEQAVAAAAGIARDEDRELLFTDLATIPGVPRFW